jgi:hypothetical protein
MALGAEPAPTLWLTIGNHAGVPGPVLVEAERHVRRIYRKVGVDLVWSVVDPSFEFSETPTASQVRSRVAMSVALIPDHLIERVCDQQTASGVAIGSSDQGGRRAYVFPDRVRRGAVAWIGSGTPGKRARDGLLLGHVIAHEIGHLLLPGGYHSIGGLMKARLGRDNLQSAA